MLFLLIFVIGFTLLSSCSSTPDRLDYALEFAGENRGELLKVLHHYEGDSLKYRAARFLIENMPHCYAYRQGGDMDSVKQIRTYSNSFGQIERKRYLRWEGYTYQNLPKIYDAHVITADYLIRNIDHAFVQWRKRPWNRNFSFDDFCEYLLPYRIGDEPLEDWRGLYEEDFRHLLDSVYTGSDVVEATEVISDYLLKPVFIYSNDFNPPLPHVGPRYLFRHRFGTCRDAADIMLYAFRSVGIPCVEDMDVRGNHVWVAIRDTTGHDARIWYINGPTERGTLDTRGYKRGKVFRQTSGFQTDKVETFCKDLERVPSFFYHPYVKDVSAEYYPDTLCMASELPDGAYCYLAYFYDGNWWSCACSRVSEGKVVFPNVESGMIYLPMEYREKIYHPAGYPVWFTGCNVNVLCPDFSNKEAGCLWRKYPYYPWIRGHVKRITGSVFEGSLYPDFRRAEPLYAVTDTPQIARNRADLPQPVVCRYIRMKAPVDKQAEVAELAVYAKGKQMVPVAVSGSEGERGNLLIAHGNVTDGNPLTYFTSQEKGGEVVLDLGHPTGIDRIDYMPRNDDNFIRQGDCYELLYHAGKEGWKRLFREVADTTFLEVDVPANALFWLRNLTRGREEHVFFMEEGKQRFPVF